MGLVEELYQLAKSLLIETEPTRTAEALLLRLLERTRAEAGFLVVREDGEYRRKFEVGDASGRSDEERRFSRSLVREAITRRELLYLPDLLADSRWSGGESVRGLGPAAVLVAPLRQGEDVFGVVYLESRLSAASQGFSEDDRAFVSEFAEIAGAFLLRASESEALERRAQGLERDLFAKHRFEGIVTRHPQMIELLRLIAQVADAPASVLIRGETGTGKELFAQALHVNSSRRTRPFVTVHCAALPGTLLESELFGHVAGAFTDARKDRVGRLASAHGGTLFLDEIGEIPLAAQAKLLRFLQFGEIQRLGSDRVEKVDARVVAATHRDLKKMIAEGSFREDLYFRLKVLEIEIPPLRERASDIPLLIDWFLRQQARKNRQAGEPLRVSPRALAKLRCYPFPGNVRELSHAIERACLLARGPELDLELLPPEITNTETPAAAVAFTELTAETLRQAREDAADEVERRFLEALMDASDGNVSRAARESGIHRSYLQKMLARHPSHPRNPRQPHSTTPATPTGGPPS